MLMGVVSCAEDVPLAPVDPSPRGPGGGPPTTDDDTDQFIGCTADADCVAALGDLGPCASPSCDPVSRNCKPLAAASGTNCDDGNPCTQAGKCVSGHCQGTPRVCSDDNPCTNDSCDPTSGKCVAEPNSALCDDGLFCTTSDKCSGGECTGQPNPQCQCQGDADCAQFDDADLCNGVLACLGNECVPKAGTVITCDPNAGGPCRDNACNPATGKCKTTPKPESTPCDDSDACTTSDACAAGVCKGKAQVCDDSNPCTDDKCAAESGCVYTPNSAACDDGDLCTVNDKCAGGACTGTASESCDCIKDAECMVFEDGNLCNGTLQCDAGKCVVESKTIVSCEAQAQAAGQCASVSCEPATGNCVTKPALGGSACDDKSACTSGDHCEDGACVGQAVVCDDTNPCTEDSCNKATGCVSKAVSGVVCDDFNDCTDNDMCQDGVCQGVGDCGCQSNEQCAAFDDGDLCNGLLECVGGECVVNPFTVVDCAAGAVNPCAKAQCIPATGECLSNPVADGVECDDGDTCTTSDHCTAGKCGGEAKSCDDGELCTDDACDALIGCVHTFNDSQCDDGNPCTVNDACISGACSGTQTQACACEATSDCAQFEDGDLCNGVLICAGGKCVTDPASVVSCPLSEDATGCLIDQCQPTTGACMPTTVPNGKPCDDGTACTLGESCQQGQCTSGGALKCDDGNPCTTDGCDPEFGCTSQALSDTSCDDLDSCTTGDSCMDGICHPGLANSCTTTCQAQWTLSCGFFHTWHTGQAGATKLLTDYACSNDSYPGGEYTYWFQAPYDGVMNLTLSNEQTATDVLVMKADEGSCNTESCLAFGYSQVDVPMVAGETYFVVVDGYFDAEDEYTITMQCTPAQELACDDGKDDDADGALDCDDPDCAAAVGCAPAACDAKWTLSCGGSDLWGNYLGGTTNVFEKYEGCGNPWTYAAPEYAYVFDAPATETVTVTLGDETAETDVLVLKAGAGDACGADGCIAYGLGGATFDAVAGQRYYVVIDGYNGAEGLYTIDVACPSGTEEPTDDPVDPPSAEDCTNTTDDDGDGLVDCEDGDCFGVSADCQPACIPDTAQFATALMCPETLEGYSNDASGSNAAVTEWSCSPDTYNAPEYVYTYVAEADTKVTVELTDEEVETDVIVLHDQGLGCNPASCLAFAYSKVTFDAKAGETYYVAVDGYLDAVGSYTITFTCGD